MERAISGNRLKRARRPLAGNGKTWEGPVACAGWNIRKNEVSLLVPGYLFLDRPPPGFSPLARAGFLRSPAASGLSSALELERGQGR